MRKLLLLGGIMLVPLVPISARADVIWDVTPMIDVITNLGNHVSITGSFTTTDEGSALTENLVLNYGPGLASEIDFSTDLGGTANNGPFDFLFLDASTIFSLEFTFGLPLDGSTNPVGIDGIMLNGSESISVGLSDVHVDVPEPASLAVLAVGLTGLAASRRKRSA